MTLRPDVINLRKLLARGEFRRIADIAIRIESRANLLFSFEKMALRDAVKTPAGARLFATELYGFLYGPGSPQRRFNDWLQALSELPQPGSRVLTFCYDTGERYFSVDGLFEADGTSVRVAARP